MDAAQSLRPHGPHQPGDGDATLQPAAPASVPARYQQLLSALTRAESELDGDDRVGRSPALEQASGIVFELLYALDFRTGGELVPRLAALYGYIGNELLNIGRTGDKARLYHLRDMIEALRRSWAEGESA